MNKHLRYLLPSILLLLSCFIVVAQKTLTLGYVITNNNDTLKGKIDNREWNSNPASVHFTDANGVRHLYLPTDIRGFGIPPNDNYLSSHVSLDLSSLQMKDLVEHRESQSVKDTALFLMTLVKGQTCLYYFKDQNDREHYYVSKGEDEPVELLIRKSAISSSEGSTTGKNYVSTLEVFKGQMILLFSDCPDMKDQINRSEYSSASLRSLVVRYNECRNTGLQFVKKEEPVKVKFGVLAGPTLTRITFKGGDNDLAGIKMTDSYNFIAGVTFSLILPRERAQWSLVDELVYKSYSNSASSSTTGWNLVKYDRTFSFKMAYIKLYTLLRYQYPKWKVRPFADFGMSNGYAIRAVSTKNVTKTIGTTVKPDSPVPAIDDPRMYEFGLLGGVGVSFWKFGVEFRYEWAQGISSLAAMSGPEKTYIFMISFLF